MLRVAPSRDEHAKLVNNSLYGQKNHLKSEINFAFQTYWPAQTCHCHGNKIGTLIGNCTALKVECAVTIGNHRNASAS